ncbi:MAG: hypothetical protein EOO11_08160 [Chitinophagaceae bacterium]|nr:MAG: hypothetical protein EOO11_08160 [Chitinophagaceae bacterium]
MKRFLLPATALLLSACSRDVDGSSCRVTKVIMYNAGGAPADEATVSYSGDRVSEVTLPDGRYTIAYDAEGRVTRRSFFRPNATSPYRYDSLHYNAERSLALLERYSSGFGSGYQRTDSVLLDWSNGQLLERRQYSMPPLSFNAPLVLQNLYRYTHTGSNITRFVRENYSGGMPSYTLTSDFDVDALPNYYNGQGPQFYLVDPTVATGLLETVHSVMMANNVVRIRTDVQPPADYGVSYVPNSRGLLSEVRLNGTPVTAYQYECR